MSRASRGRRCQPASAAMRATGSAPQRERLETAAALPVAVGRNELDAGQAQAVVGAGAVRGERPRGQARQAVLGRERAAALPSRATAPGAPRRWCRGSPGRRRSRAPWRPSSRRSASAGRRAGRRARLRSRRRRRRGSASGRRARAAPPAAARPGTQAGGRRAVARPAATPSRCGTGRAGSASRRPAWAPRCGRARSRRSSAARLPGRARAR